MVMRDLRGKRANEKGPLGKGKDWVQGIRRRGEARR